MLDVFLSYGRRDEDLTGLVRELYDALGRLGRNVWWDQEVPAGVPYAHHIAQKLAEAKVVVVLWGKSSVTSEWVYSEAETARSTRKYVGVQFEDCSVPLPFNALHIIDFRNWDRSADASCFLRLAKDLNDRLAPPDDRRRQILFRVLARFSGPQLGRGFLGVHDWNEQTVLSQRIDLSRPREQRKLRAILADLGCYELDEFGDPVGDEPEIVITAATTIGEIVDWILVQDDLDMPWNAGDD